MSTHRLEIEVRGGMPDAKAEATRQRLEAWLGYRPEKVRTRKVYHLDLGLTEEEAQSVLDALCDPVAEVGRVGNLPDGGDRPWLLSVGFLPGVTDTVGASVKRAAEDCLGRKLEGRVYSSTLYSLSGLERNEVEEAAKRLLYNPQIERMRLEQAPRETIDLELPIAGSRQLPVTARVPLREASDDALLKLSNEGMLALNLEEMKAIQAHFEALERDPTDAELECLAQTWSEHCKHKIFASPIRYTDPNGHTKEIEKGLFRTYIRGATEAIARKREHEGIDEAGKSFLVSVFHDNAGVVRFTDSDHLVYKVETHNSPSALDPYGGAMTGIVGVNRDSFGTGLGADLLTNVWGYCLGRPDDPRREGEDLPPGLMHPRRIRDGVHEGVIDGGNHSGIPYSRGFELFDDRYAGKPLVYCGTVAAMPVNTAGRPTHQKETRVGDLVVMLGGRIGKDGIHGATFSSVELDEDAPVQAVQIGDPITQKMMFDMLSEARDRGLYSAMTDNGAGGLSSSVGEMAEATGGARIDLEKAPLKYDGLAPWEILISEAQERMTVAVRPELLDAFLSLAVKREVEATVLGEFTDSGRFEVFYGEEQICDLSLDFMHDGVPLPVLDARWDPPAVASSKKAAEALEKEDTGALLDTLLARPCIASGEERARHYDHEVKGLSVIKPFVGVHSDVPATATVMRVRHGRDEGVVLGEGIHPFYSDIDSDAMARASVDEGVRRILCAGARWDRMAALDNFCWPDPIRSEKTPDGHHKLAQLVRCCEGLYEACETYGLPLISGKDSMKNDAFLGGVKISIPPTLLVSVIGQMEDVSKALTLESRFEGDSLFLLGTSRSEWGGSELARVKALRFDSVPRTDLAESASRYQAFAAARDAGMIHSAHALGRGGLGVAVAQVVMASAFGLEVELDGLADGPASALFGESTGRILFTASSGKEDELRAQLGAHGLQKIGRVGAAGSSLDVRLGGETLFRRSSTELRRPFQEGLRGY